MGGEVHGSVYALIRAQADFPKEAVFLNPHVFLPDISVYLENTNTKEVSTPVTTDLDGMFMIPKQPQAVYHLCWKSAGFSPGCSAQTFVLRSGNINLQPVGIQPLTEAVFGRVTLKDTRPCRFVAPTLGVNTWTTLTAEPFGALAKVRANNSGEYVFPSLPSGAVKITASCEGISADTIATLTGAAVRADLIFPNSSPVVSVAFATVGGKMVRSGAQGITVEAKVEARPGAFPLHYRWASSPPSSGFVSADSPTVSWKVPGPGIATLYVLVHDGRGGNVLGQVKLSTTPNHIVFSGQVRANDVPFAAGAEVTINGVSATTNGWGQFALALPREDLRYVVTIVKPGYQLLSRILYAPVTGALFKLYRAQDFIIDPRGPISVTERSPKETDQEKGVQVRIPVDSLAAGADGKGALAVGPLHLYALSYNLRDPENQLPGDYAGLQGGQSFRLSSFGSADIQIRDGAGRTFNLAPGKTATITLPIDSNMLTSAPTTIPYWHYDLTQGAWLREGSATRVGNAYEVRVTHFSAVNMDLAFTDAACTVINVDTGVMPVPFKLRMTPLSGGFVVAADHQNQVIGDALNVVVREPPNTQVRFDVVDSNGDVISAASQIITTGAASPSGALWNPPPNPPYSDCTSHVDYNVHTVQALFPTPPPGFLAFRTPNNYLDPATANGLTTAYYALIDLLCTHRSGRHKDCPRRRE